MPNTNGYNNEISRLLPWAQTFASVCIWKFCGNDFRQLIPSAPHTHTHSNNHFDKASEIHRKFILPGG